MLRGQDVKLDQVRRAAELIARLDEIEVVREALLHYKPEDRLELDVSVPEGADEGTVVGGSGVKVTAGRVLSIMVDLRCVTLADLQELGVEL